MGRADRIALKFAIGLGLVPHLLFVFALFNVIVSCITEGNAPAGDPNIGVGVLLLTVLMNVPSMICWLGYFISRYAIGTRAT